MLLGHGPLPQSWTQRGHLRRQPTKHSLWISGVGVCLCQVRSQCLQLMRGRQQFETREGGEGYDPSGVAAATLANRLAAVSLAAKAGREVAGSMQ